MHLPEFDHSRMFWDDWRAFHVGHTLETTFVQFDTGEFVIRDRHWHPGERRVYKALHLQITATGDKDCPRLFVPGQDKPIPVSHLTYKGKQELLLDLDHKRAVALWPRLDRSTAPSPIPERFLDQHIVAYYAGPQSLPVGSAIKQHYPQPLTRTQRAHLEELVNACKVWLHMQADPSALMRQHRDARAFVLDHVASPFSAMTETKRTAVVVNGFDGMIVEVKHPWLTFNVNSEEKE